MGFWGFGRRRDTHLVVVTSEGGTQLRLNGIRVQAARTKRNAAAHEQTVCWVEFEPGGPRTDQGPGPAAARLGAGEVERLLRELPQTAECRAVRGDLEGGQERAGHWLHWGRSGRSTRGGMGDKSRAPDPPRK